MAPADSTLMLVTSRRARAAPCSAVSRRSPEPRQQIQQGLAIQPGNGLRQAVGKLGCQRIEAGRVDHHPWMGQLRQPAQLVHIVPGKIEIGRDLLHEAAGRAPAMAMLQRREIGLRDAESLGHILQPPAALAAQFAQPPAEGSHASRCRFSST